MRKAAALDRLLATILFTDIVGSTERASELGDHRWHVLLDEHNACVRALLEQFGGRELDTAGDGFFASFEGPGAAVRCACAIARSVRELDLEIRAGVHTGECERIGDKLAGVAIHVGARIAATARGGEVLVSRTVRRSRCRLGSEVHGPRDTSPTRHRRAVAAFRRRGRAYLRDTTHGLREHMSALDRALVHVARHAPAAERLGARLASDREHAHVNDG